MEQFVVSVERELANEDCGSDLPSVNRLLKELQGVEEEMDGHRDRIQVQARGWTYCLVVLNPHNFEFLV